MFYLSRREDGDEHYLNTMCPSTLIVNTVESQRKSPQSNLAGKDEAQTEF